MAPPVAWLWNFGDGTISTLRYPDHIYTMAGVYYYKVTVTDQYGASWVSEEGAVRVYDYIVEGTAISRGWRTNKCYRMPILAHHGYGPSEYQDGDNAGLDWLWPSAGVGAEVFYDDDGDEVALIVDSKTEQVGQINLPEVWRDRQGSDYGGNRIISTIRQKEEHSSLGEHVAISHIEGHLYFKPYDRGNANTEDYDSEGYPENMRVDQNLIRDGVVSNPESEAIRVPKDGDLVFPDRFEARTLQKETIIYEAPWMLTGTRDLYDTEDKAQRPSLRQMTETTFLRRLATMPLFYVPRDRTSPYFNFATGADSTGTFSQRITGPDQRPESALYFATPNFGLSDTMPEELSGDFTLIGWYNQILSGDLPIRLWDIGNLHIDIIAGWSLQINDGVNPVITQPISFRGIQWGLLIISRSHLNFDLWENDSYLGQYAGVSIENYGTDIELLDNKAGAVFCPKVLPRALDDETVEFYYDDVINKSGTKTLPIY